MAVYTEVSFEELEKLLEQYDIGTPMSFKGIAEGIENSNFYLQTDRGAFLRTLDEKRVAAEDLPFFLGLMEHLAKAGVHCPLPVKTRDGQSLVSLNRRNAAIVTFLTGIALRRPDVAHCAAGGAARERRPSRVREAPQFERSVRKKQRLNMSTPHCAVLKVPSVTRPKGRESAHRASGVLLSAATENSAPSSPKSRTNPARPRQLQFNHQSVASVLLCHQTPDVSPVN